MRVPERFWTLMLLLFSGALSAQLADGGPITVTADEAEWSDNQQMAYRGDVRLASDTLELTGDRLVLTQPEGGALKALIEGAPAALRHRSLGDNGAAQPPVAARAERLDYDAATGWVILEGNARLTRGEDSIDGATIRYNLRERRVQATSGNGGAQVRIVIQPPASTSAPASEADQETEASTPGDEAGAP